ncbi:hypothetical protein [Chachezhania sediminis]|uniref:hypothetical protein n=1 Tax=Chachezhania sediminis TaxID=2599291 RepID=UPI001E62BB6A|nr:hypothetical protein [Chachezhania sediminis]
MDMADEGVIARIEAAPFRRWMGVGIVATLAALVAYLAIEMPWHLPRQAAMLIGAAVILWFAVAMQRATGLVLVLTETELRDSSGAVLARVADIVRVERGLLAFKPSNGFVITLSEPVGRVWKPGLWWRMGRRVGVGGVLPAGQSKAMADMLAAMLVERKG